MLGTLGTLGSSALNYFLGDRAASQQGQRSYRYNSQLQEDAQAHSAQMYNQSWSDQQAENRWMWNQQKSEGRYYWEDQKRENQKYFDAQKDYNWRMARFQQEDSRGLWRLARREGRFWAKHGHRINVQSLRNAGLNPILAVRGSGFNAANAPAMRSSGVSGGGMSSQHGAKGTTGISGSSSPSTWGAGTNSASAQAARYNINLAQDYATLRLINKQVDNVESNTRFNQMKTAGEAINNSAKQINLKEKEAKSVHTVGKRGQVWRNILIPTKNIIDTINPFSKLNPQGK